MHKSKKFPHLLDVNISAKQEKKSKGKQLAHLSPSPKVNPFNSFLSFEKLPKLRPISPDFLKMPKSPGRILVPQTAQPRTVTLKLFQKNPRLISPKMRNIYTPKFFDKD